MTKTYKIIIWIVALAALVGLVYLTMSSKNIDITDNSQDVATTTGLVSTTTTKGGTVITGAPGGYTIEQVPIGKGKGLPQPVPDLNRAVTVSSGAVVAPEAKAAATLKIKSLQTRLKVNAADFNAWIDLGIYQKSAGDYQGAVLSWSYASKLSQIDYISLANLGNLYAYFIKDNKLAESYYKQAIVKNSSQPYLYVQLAEVYRDVIKDTVKARAIVDEGLSKIPNEPNLLQLQASLK